jgi:hypothetical protein
MSARAQKKFSELFSRATHLRQCAGAQLRSQSARIGFIGDGARIVGACAPTLARAFRPVAITPGKPSILSGSSAFDEAPGFLRQ